jgi:hypothetical protein
MVRFSGIVLRFLGMLLVFLALAMAINDRFWPN